MICAARREIGGIIMGEELGENLFRIVDFTVDMKSGTKKDFFRNSEEHDQALADFFKKTGGNYCRFNYLGEWHTHPNYNVYPSSNDISSMQNLVDETGGVEFAVLFISRLKWLGGFECGAYLFVQNHNPSKIDVIYE